MRLKYAKKLVIILGLLSFSQFTVADSYEDYKNDKSSENAFLYLYQVATHPRCANCHGVIEDGVHKPTIGDERRPHPMNITAANNLRLMVKDGKFVQTEGQQALNCRSCHQDSNGSLKNMPPGAANDLMPGFIWHMPPLTMAIEKDLSEKELCENWLNPAKNSFLAARGGRDNMDLFEKEFVHHIKDDPLIIWSWTPGEGRTPAPGTHKDAVEAIKIWIEANAKCPNSN